MLYFWIAFAAFMLSHVVIARTGLRGLLVWWMGLRRYLVAYSILSLILLGLVIHAAQLAPRIPLWPWHHTLYWIPNLLMPLACVFLVAGFTISNPLSIAPRASGFDPARPCLTLAVTRHPVLWGFFLWAFSHIFPNGEFPLAFLFLTFALFALTGSIMIDRRRKREMGAALWQKTAGQTRNIPLTATILWRGDFSVTRGDVAGIGGGVLLYLSLYHIHAYLFGISPTPPL